MSAGQSFNQRVTRPLVVMFLTIGLLLGGGLTLAKLRPSATTDSSGNPPNQSAAPTTRPAVNVFNGTATAGLARQVSEVLVSRGWEISQVGNWTGKPLPKTTIYYPAGYSAAADVLAKETSSVTKQAPADISQSSLTLVLMK